MIKRESIRLPPLHRLPSSLHDMIWPFTIDPYRADPYPLVPNIELEISVQNGGYVYTVAGPPRPLYIECLIHRSDTWSDRMYKFPGMDEFDQKKYANRLGIEAYQMLLTELKRTWRVGGEMLNSIQTTNYRNSITEEWARFEFEPKDTSWWTPFFGADQEDVTVTIYVDKVNWTKQRTNELCKLVAQTIASKMNEAHLESRTGVCIELLSAKYDSERLTPALQRIHPEKNEESDGSEQDSEEESDEEWLNDAPTDRADKVFQRADGGDGRDVYYLATTMCGSHATQRFRQQVFGDT